MCHKNLLLYTFCPCKDAMEGFECLLISFLVLRENVCFLDCGFNYTHTHTHTHTLWLRPLLQVLLPLKTMATATCPLPLLPPPPPVHTTPSTTHPRTHTISGLGHPKAHGRNEYRYCTMNIVIATVIGIFYSRSFYCVGTKT